MKKNWTGLNFLVVEDDIHMADTLCAYFKKGGANVFPASNGEMGLRVVENERIDFVLSDIQMPIMDGVELLKKIRQKNSKLPVVLLATGQADVTEETVLENGASGLLHKPFDLKKLTEHVNQLLGIKE